jgi:hypothetical protein
VPKIRVGSYVLCALLSAGLAPAVFAQTDPPTAPAAETEQAAQIQPADGQTLETGRFPLSAGAEIVFTSAYIWRGFVPTDAMSYEPTSWVKFGDITVSSWFNIAGDQPTGPITEHDLTVDYSKGFGSWTVSGGYINYVFPGASTDRVTHEFYGGVALAGPLNPTVKVFQDVHAGTGTYVAMGASQSVALKHGVTLTPGVVVAYNHHQWIDDSDWSDANFSLKLSIPFPRQRVWLTPFMAYSKSLNEDFFPNKFYGGVGIAVR